MSSTGVRRKRTPFDIAIESLRDTNNVDIERMKLFSAESSPISGNVGGASTNSATPGGSFLNIAGQTPMLGAIAFNPVTVLIDSNGRIDITPGADAPSNYSTYVLMTGAGTPDDLRFIDGAANNGQLLYLQGTATQVLTIKHAIIGVVSNIVGTTTVTVTTSTAHGLTTGNLVDISGTTNFNIQNASITVTGGTTFTYAAAGSATPESGAFQNGNVVTSDGADIVLDGTTTNAIPWIALLFDPVSIGFGAWRVQFGASAGGSGDGTGSSIQLNVFADVLSNVTTQYLGFGEFGASSFNTEVSRQSIVPVDSTLQTISLHFLGTSTITSGSFDVTIRRNGADLSPTKKINVSTVGGPHVISGINQLYSASDLFTVEFTPVGSPVSVLTLTSMGIEWNGLGTDSSIQLNVFADSVSNSVTEYVGFGEFGGGSLGAEGNRQSIVPVDRTLKTLAIHFTGTITSGSFDVTVRRAGADLSPTKTINVSTVAGPHIISNIDQLYSAGDLLTIEFVPVGSPVAALTLTSMGAEWNGSSGGGVSFPIDFPSVDLGTVTTTQTIDFDTTTRHSVKMEIGAASVALDFSNVSSTTTLEISSITTIQDGSGGRAITFVPTVINKQVIIDAFAASAAGQGISFIIELENGLLTAYLKTGNVVSGGAGFLSGLTIDVNKDWATKSITNLAAIQYVDPGAVVRGSILGEAATSSIRLATVAGGKFLISDVITDIVEFTDAVGLKMLGTHLINMNKQVINTIGSLQLDRTVTFTPVAIDTIGFDDSTKALKYNVALITDIHSFQAAGELLGAISRVASNSGLLSIDNVVSNLLQADEQLFLASASTPSPLNNGAIWRASGTGLFQFRQNGVTEQLGGEAITWTVDHDANGNELLNFGGLDSDAANLPASGKIRLGNNELASWVKTDNVSIVSLGLRANDLLGITGGNLTLTGNDIVDTNELEGRLSNPLSINVPTSGQVLNLQFVGSTEWTFSSSTLGGSNVVLDNSLILNDGSAFPVSSGEFTRNGTIVSVFAPIFEVMNETSVAAEQAQLNLTKVDSAPANGEEVAEINFLTRDTGVEVIYGSIAVENVDVTDNAAMSLNVRADNGLIAGMIISGDDNNQRFNIFIGGSGQSRIQPVLDRMGYFVTPQVTDFSLNLGTAGSLEIPILTDGSPNNAALNSAFGAFDGAMGYETVDNRLYIREGNLDWSFWTRDGAVTS